MVEKFGSSLVLLIFNDCINLLISQLSSVGLAIK